MTARKTLFAALAAATAVAAVAAPAAAQSYGHAWNGDRAQGYDHAWNGDRAQGYDHARNSDRAQGYGRARNSNRAQTFDLRIDQGLRNGELSRREHAQLSAELDQIVRVEASYRQHGMDYRERADLERRYDRLTQDIKRAGYDRDRRQYGYGYRR